MKKIHEYLDAALGEMKHMQADISNFKKEHPDICENDPYFTELEQYFKAAWKNIVNARDEL